MMKPPTPSANTPLAFVQTIRPGGGTPSILPLVGRVEDVVMSIAAGASVMAGWMSGRSSLGPARRKATARPTRPLRVESAAVKIDTQRLTEFLSTAELSPPLAIPDPARRARHKAILRGVMARQAAQSHAVGARRRRKAIPRNVMARGTRAKTAIPAVEAHPFLLLRTGFAVLLVLLTGGLLLSSFAMVTNAGPLLRGLAVTALWAGKASLAVAAHMEGRRSGVYLFGERMSRSVTILAVGMTIVAIVATVEFSLR